MDGMSPSHRITIHWRQQNRTITHDAPAGAGQRAAPDPHHPSADRRTLARRRHARLGRRVRPVGDVGRLPPRPVGAGVGSPTPGAGVSGVNELTPAQLRSLREEFEQSQRRGAPGVRAAQGADTELARQLGQSLGVGVCRQSALKETGGKVIVNSVYAEYTGDDETTIAAALKNVLGPEAARAVQEAVQAPQGPSESYQPHTFQIKYRKASNGGVLSPVRLFGLHLCRRS